METLDRSLLQIVKQGFVPMAGGGAEPVAGASDMTAAMAGPPMGGGAAGGMPMDPAAAGGGMPMDPSMMGGAPMDPSMMGAAPPTDPSMGGMPADPAMMGGPPPADPSMMGGGSVMSITVPEFIELIRVIRGDKPSAEGGAPAEGGGQAGAGGGEAAAPKKPKTSTADLSAKLDQILQALQGGGAAPAPAPAAPPPMG